jgi:hypothetical protein
MQFELPARPTMTRVDPDLIAKQPSMSKALALCQTLSGKDDAQFYGESGIVKDQAQWSRIMGPSNHCFPHDKFNLFMDLAGNEAPLLWLLHARGYDMTVLRKLETETERKLRITEEALAAEKLKTRVLTEAINGRAA